MNVFAVLFGVPVWGFAVLWIALATELTVRTLRRGMPFALTWWSLTFPVGTFVTGTTQLANHTGLPAFKVAAADGVPRAVGHVGTGRRADRARQRRRESVHTASGRRAHQGQEGSAAERVSTQNQEPRADVGSGGQTPTRSYPVYRPTPRRRYTPGEISSQASRIAATPWPPAAQIEIRPRTGPPVSLLLGELLGQLRDDPPAGRGERVARGQRRAVDVELGPVDAAQCRVQAEPLLAVLLGLPRRSVASTTEANASWIS